MSTTFKKTIIIGAGAAGLASARELQYRNEDFIIIEKGLPGESWRNMPEHLCLISPWQANHLEDSKDHRIERSVRQESADYANYLSEFTKLRKFPISNNTTVIRVTKDDELFLIETSKGLFTCNNLIYAGGHFNNPSYPSYFNKIKDEIKCIHFKDFKSARELKEQGIRSVLIVGKRLSAGQLIVELSNEGIACDISIRSKLEFGARPFIFNFFLKFVDEIENLLFKFMTPSKNPVDVKMESGLERKYIESQKVLVQRDIDGAKDGTIYFQGGKSKSYDLVIFATGFNPHIKPLENLNLNDSFPKLNNNFESTSCPCLFYVGFPGQTNFRSRFLRGIRSDVKQLVKLIK
ncbi:hypothetical protein A9Q84_12155 [Halobacteriovorax marinus]|uniref:FAD/NAD(P)-binding domain-containing protein n=1 Tax=Halobacteriovorax marinus TaxID=97084 RepID=A0A1Y5F810_9BACT|nr:hypothetical protein A9Q84_12155 [Halobacteriovorax marinus]